jgi:hypothetical protein
MRLGTEGSRMNNITFKVCSASPALVLFLPARRIARSRSGLNKLPARREVEFPAVKPVRWRVPIRVWRARSWAKKIVGT